MEGIYKYGKEEFSADFIISPQIEFSDLVGSGVETYIKEGSLKNIQGSSEIWVKLPNWGDVRLWWYYQPITFVQEVFDNSIKERVKYLVTSVKSKVEQGDNSGYNKHYFTDLCWMQKDSVFTSVEEIEKTIDLLLSNGSLKELENNKDCVYFEIGGKGI